MSFWRGKRVLVTGGAGFLGSHVVQALTRRGVDAPLIVRSQAFDLTHEHDVRRLFEQHAPDVVIHLAGLVAGILANKERPAEFFYQNLMMGTLALHYAQQSGASVFVAAGAGCGYPEFAPNPLKEEDFWAGFPQKESAPYSLAKRLLSIQSEAYFRQYGFVSIIGIPGNIYGPHDNFNLRDAHVIPALVRKFVEAADGNADRVEVWGSGKAARDFVYAGDVAEGLLLATEKLSAPALINLSSGIETTVADVVNLLRRLTGFSGAIDWNSDLPDGQMHRRFDTSKAASLLDWHATTSLEQGLALTVEWYRAHREEARK